MKVLSLRKLHFRLSVLCLCVFSVVGVSAQDKDWRPVSPAELSSKTALVDPSADAEAIFWEVRVDDSSVTELAMRHYVRVKIFTERGREQFSKHDILFTKGTKVKDVEARVTKPDGSVVLLQKEDVLEREIVRASGIKVKAKTFAIPGLEIGSIVEYRYREVLDNAEANMRLIFQREVPIQTISYYVKPFSGDRGMYYEPFNTPGTKWEKDKNGYHRATMTNVPAFIEESTMAPEDEVRSWMYIYYQYGPKKAAQEYWTELSKFAYEKSKGSMKATDDIKKVTAEVIAGASTDDEKLRRIFNYTKTQIRNLHYSAKVTDEEWKRAYATKSAAEALKLKYGTGNSVDMVFAAMARAAGYDARPSFSGSRNEMMFNPNVANASLMVNSSSVAILLNGKWTFFSPGSYYSNYGMLSWAEEGQGALIADGKELILKPMDHSPAELSRETRTGKFKLLDDGTLEGEATIEYTGHWAAYVKGQNRNDSFGEQEKNFINKIKSAVLGSAEVEAVAIENVDDPHKPLVYRFKLRVPGFASRTGKRLFFQPNVFERSAKPRFTAASRKYDISFSYPYSEKDDITIELPAGFSLENADSPSPLKDTNGIGSHEVKMGMTKDGKMLVYQRDFSFGNKGFVRFPVASYASLKALFESFNKADIHQLTLRESATATVSK